MNGTLTIKLYILIAVLVGTAAISSFITYSVVHVEVQPVSQPTIVNPVIEHPKPHFTPYKMGRSKGY